MSTGYKNVPYHIIFACKVDIHRKTRLVIDRNRRPSVHKEGYYAPFLPVIAISLGFLFTQTNNLKCVAGDIGMIFLHHKPQRNSISLLISSTQSAAACLH